MDSTQLNNYKKIKEYVPGKKNPFATLESENTTNDTTTENTQNGGSSSQVANNTTEENTGYLPDKGTK